MNKFYNSNLDLCPNFDDYEIPLYLPFQAETGKRYSVTYEGKLMNVEILSKQFGYCGIVYWVKILEYPAKKVIVDGIDKQKKSVTMEF